VFVAMMLAMMESLRSNLNPDVETAFSGIIELIFALLLIAVAAAFYFIPTIVAAAKKSKRAAAVAALNFLLGWTVLGWVVALVWAVAEPEGTANLPKVKCPYCLNEINHGSRICQFCHAQFTA